MRMASTGILLRRDAADEGEIPAFGLIARFVQIPRQPVMDGGDEIRVRQRYPLRIGDRDQRHIAEPGIEGQAVAEILPSMQRGQGGDRLMPEDRKVKMIDVKMQHVELGGMRADLVEHQHVVGHGVADRSVEAQRLGAARHEIRGGDRIAAREQRHLVAQRDQFLGEIGDDALGAPIEPGRHALDQRGNLRDFHWTPFSCRGNRKGGTIRPVVNAAALQ